MSHDQGLAKLLLWKLSNSRILPVSGHDLTQVDLMGFLFQTMLSPLATGKATTSAGAAGTSKIGCGFKCRLCEEKFPTDEERKRHYDSAHPGEKVGDFD